MDSHQKAFLSHAEATYAILPDHSYEEENGKIMAFVTATFPTKEVMETHIPATGFTPTGWDCNDSEKHCRRKGKVFIVNGRQRIEAPYTKAEEFPYTHLASQKGAVQVGNEQKQSTDLLPGMKGIETDIERFQRKDDKIVEIKSSPKEIIAYLTFDGKPIEADTFMKDNPAGTKGDVEKFSVENKAPKDKLEHLYQVVIRETVEPAFFYDSCREHKEERTFKGASVRHAYDIYTAVPTTRTLNKITPEGEEKTIITGPREVLLTLHSQEKLGAGQKNRPTCTLHRGGELPPGYRLTKPTK